MVSARRTAIARRTKRLWGYWRAETRTLRQGLVALALSTLASFIAGLTLGHLAGTLTLLPGLLVLIPAAVGMRGTIFGAIGARLGTSAAAGLFEVSLDRSGVLYRNVEVSILTTLMSSLWLAMLAKLAVAVLGGASISLWSLVTISVVGGLLGSILILLVTLGLTIVSYRRGYDLDSVATPIVTALGDMGTLPTLYLATFIARNDVVNGLVAGICVILAVAALARAVFTRVPGVRRIVLEMTAVMLLTPLLDIAAGAILQAKQPSLTLLPGLLILIPPFVSQAGALGGILSSRLTSKLQLGVITARGRPESPALIDMSLVAGEAVVIFVAIGALGFALAGWTGLATPGATAMIGGTVLAGLLMLPLILATGYYVAILTSRFGLDPDDQSVPIITSLMDLAGVVAIFIAMSLSGVFANG
jgi:mgtE-like transporter